MLAQVTNNPALLTDIAKVVHDVVPSLNPVDVGVTLLTISKIAQLAYKHWTVEGSWLDKLCEKVGVVQTPPAPIVNVVQPPTLGK